MNIRKLVYTLVLLATFSVTAQSVVETHGRLRVQGNQIVDQSLNPTSIAGNSLFWSNAGDSADYYNAATVDHLADNWGSTLIRCAMGVKEPWDGGTGYIDSPNFQETKIRRVIDAAIAKGIYVIIDWHTHEAENYEAEAVEFFTKMARIYGDEPNVIYEIYNEPINQSWPTIKNYAEAVIAGIRSEDPDNLIVVGTPFFSQNVDVASLDPISDVNTAYTLHFYAGTHGNNERERAITAMNNGVALFVTEWGSVNADGNGNADTQGTQEWMDFLRDNNLSHANWAVSDKNEGASIVQSGAGLNGLLNNQLTGAGLLLQDIIANWETSTIATDTDPSDPSDPSDPTSGVCNTIDCIRNAMAAAQPGDEIIIASGTYQMTNKIPGNSGRNSYLYATTSGTESNPIVLRAENSSNPPIIKGIDYNDGYLLSVDGDYWDIVDIHFQTGSKGLMLDNANNIKLLNVEISDVGDEALHFRDGSSDNLVDGCTIRDIGVNQPGFGEGIYVGSDRSQHDRYNPESNNNTIQNSMIGPNVAAEGVDVREGTQFTIIRNCTFSAEGISGENSADAFIDLKGAYTFVYNNTFNLDGSTILNAGIDFLDRGTGFNTGFRNAIFDNTFNLGSRASEIPTARRRQGSPVETHVWDNTRIPESEHYPISNGTINFISEFCPEWNILPCDDTNPNVTPTVSITNPSNNISLEEGYNTLVVEADADDSDGNITGVELFIDNVLVRNDSNAPYEWGLGNNSNENLGLPVGTHTFRVVATDDSGATAEDTFTLTVTAANELPTISITNPSNDSISLEEGYNTLVVVADADDSDGNITGVELFIDNVLVRNDSNAPYEWGLDNNSNENLGLSVGVHTFRVVATDNDGATAEDTFELTVTAANQPPAISFVDPTGDISLEEGYTALVVDATATDSDGTIAGLELYIDSVLIREEVNAPYIWGTGLNESETLGLTIGDHEFRVVATDDDGATSQDTFVLTVTEAPNQIPTVSFTNPTGDLTLEEGYTSLPLEANATDTDGTIAGVELFIDGQSIRIDTTSPYTWGSGTDENETLDLTTGTYTFRIVATDDEGATAEDTFVLTVTELPNEAPTVAFTNPTADLTVQEGYTSLELTAEALDSDGTIASVGLFIDDVFVRNENVAPYDFGQGLNIDETLGLGAGTYVIKVIATDDDGATSEDTFVLTVTEAPNQVPTVAFTNPTGDLTLQEGYTFLPLEANAIDADGTIAGVELFIDGQSIRTDTTSPYIWGSGTNENETLGLAVGTYTFSVLATDDEGATAEDTFTFTVTAAAENQVPTVMFSDPSQDLTVQEGYTSLPIEASASDADGTITSVGLFINGQFIRNDFDAPYTWGSGANLDETLRLAPGTYTLRVLAIDDEGATAEDTFVLTVTALPNEAPTVDFTSPIGDLTLEEGYISLPLEATAMDADGTIASVELFIDGQSIRTDTTAPYTWGSGTDTNETLGLTVGTYTFRIVATDDEGATAEDTFTLIVTAAAENQIPTVMFSDPSEDLTVQEGYTSLPLEASASDADGTIANVGLYIDGQFIRNDFDAPYTWGSGVNQDETLGLAPGVYTLRVLATDDDGATAEDTILLTVTALPNEAPTVAFTNPAGDLSVQEGYTSLELTAEASDSDGTIASVGLFIDGQLIRNDFNAPHIWGGGNDVAETLGLTPGSYTFTVIATDDEGATAEDTFTLTVTAVAENQVPTVMFSDPNQDLTIQEGYTSLPLEASALDADGTIANVGLYIDGQFIRNDFDAPYTWGSGANQDETLGLAPGVYTLRVLAIDNQGATAEDTILLTVTALPNEAPTVEFTNPTGDLTVEEGYVSLPLTAQALDSDGTIESVGLYIDGVFVRSENVAPYDFGQGNNVAETLGLTPGSYTFTVIATDDEGATAEDTFTLTVTAVAENQAPGVAFTTPFEETLTVEEGYDSLELVAEAFDDDGSIVSVGLYIDGVFIRNDFESQFNWGIGDNAGETLGLTAGTYTFTVIATDNDGATAEDTFILTVTAVAENQAPGVAFTTPFEETLTVEEGYDSLELVAEAFDDDGSIVSVGLYIDGVLIRNDFDPQFNWGIGDNASETLGLTAGTYTFTVIVTDNEGATAEDTFVLTVESVLSIDSNISEREISMYPNPAGNQIFITGINQEEVDISIVDMLGRVVLEKARINENTPINISNLSEATYIVVVEFDNSTSIIRRLIKSKN